MKIICIGRNYAEHAKELQNEVPSEPVIFLKPETALLEIGRDFHLPKWSHDIHHEIEIVVKIHREGKNISAGDASRYYDSVSVGLDFTARDVQSELKAKGHPWERAKAFDDSAFVGRFLSIVDLGGTTDKLEFHLVKNGESVQKGNTCDMLFSIPNMIEDVSRFLTLKPGDLLFTGTPAGVGKVNPGDVLEGFLEGESLFELPVR